MSNGLQIKVKTAPKSMFLLISAIDQQETDEYREEANHIANQIVLKQVDSPFLSTAGIGKEAHEQMVFLGVYLEDGHGVDGFSYALPLIFQFKLEKLCELSRAEVRRFLTGVARSKKDLADMLYKYVDDNLLSLARSHHTLP